LTALGSGVNTATTTSLETKFAAEILEIFTSGEEGQASHGSSAETCTKVGRAGKDVSEMVVVHKVFAHALKDLSDDASGFSESVKDGVHVVALLHGDNSGVVFLVDPDKEVSSLVMEDTTSIRPVAATSGREKEGGVGLLEEVSSSSESFFLSMAHTVGLGSVRSGASEREVISLELSIELHQSLNEAVFNVSSLLERVAGRKSESSDTASSSATSG